MNLMGFKRKTTDEKYAAYWLPLRNDVEGANRALTRLVFERARKVFLDHYAKGKESPRELTAEYDKDEFLLIVDGEGSPSGPVLNMLEVLYKTTQDHPEFARWFKEDVMQEGQHTGAPVILAARWLCHLVGLRHSTVEIFIDPPDRPGYTLVQVRGMDKFEAPGAFDIPCAGHISGTDTVEESLKKELSEELNLSLDDLWDLQMLARYNSFAGENAPALGPVNHEHRVLFRASLKPEAADKIRFADGEVAGLTVFAVSELRELVRRYPERVASGLSDAIGYYM